MSMQSIPVLIVGAGPTGLNLANLLSEYGITYRLVEQKIEPIQTSNALVVQARSLEMWDSMGLAEKAIARGKKILGLSLSDSKKHLGELNFATAGLETQFPFLLGLPQAETERLLAEHLEQKGGKIERGITLTDFTQTEDKITAELKHNSGEKETVICDWLIAADGCHSSIRKKLNLNFKGATIPEKFIMMDAEISANFNLDYFHSILSPFGPLVFAPLPHFTRIICSVTHDKIIKDFNHPTVEDFNNVIQQRCHESVKINKPIWISHFLTHHRLIDHYQQGRVLFVGDSAHIHSPVGGQGMNTGMQDTFNLAWKLALVTRHGSLKTLLHTYAIERRPVAKNVLSSTTKMTRMVTLKNPLLIFFRNTLLKWMLRRKKIQLAIAKTISELALSYKPNSIIINNGQRAPDVPEFRSLLRGLKHKVLIFTGENTSPEHINEIAKITDWVNKNATEFFDPIIISDTNHIHKAYSLKKGGICVVRPDQYIALSTSKIDCKILKLYYLRFIRQ